jgi:dienelactone hydrolase
MKKRSVEGLFQHPLPIALIITDFGEEKAHACNIPCLQHLSKARQYRAENPHASRIAVMGFSKGGFAALYSSLTRFQQMDGPQNVEFAAYIPFYARCETRFIDDEKLSNRPVRMFHGAADDWVPVEPCEHYAERLRRAGNDVQLTVYAAARHAFDNPLFQPERRFPDAEVSTRCHREERPGG